MKTIELQVPDGFEAVQVAFEIEESSKCRKPRWRAERGDPFFSIHYVHGVIEMNDHHTDKYDQLYRNDNYFKTYEAARIASDKIKHILKHSKEE